MLWILLTMSSIFNIQMMSIMFSMQISNMLHFNLHDQHEFGDHNKQKMCLCDFGGLDSFLPVEVKKRKAIQTNPTNTWPLDNNCSRLLNCRSHSLYCTFVHTQAKAGHKYIKMGESLENMDGNIKQQMCALKSFNDTLHWRQKLQHFQK